MPEIYYTCHFIHKKNPGPYFCEIAEKLIHLKGIPFDSWTLPSSLEKYFIICSGHFYDCPYYKNDSGKKEFEKRVYELAVEAENKANNLRELAASI